MGKIPMMPANALGAVSKGQDLFKKPQRAKIFEVNESLEEVKGTAVECMFNPSEYTVNRTNSYQEESTTEGAVTKTHFVSVGNQSLQLSLTFDGYEDKTDITEKTRKLWKFTEPKKKVMSNGVEKGIPVQVAFEWGSFRFIAFITNLSEKFTLFTYEGVPVRAKVEVTFTQYTDHEDYPPTNPTSGGGSVERVRKVLAGDRLDMIAAEVYRDATQWRRIADYNHLRNPLALRPGQILRIPLD
jgi:nucleoid-associated protein YgaU